MGHQTLDRIQKVMADDQQSGAEKDQIQLIVEEEIGSSMKMALLNVGRTMIELLTDRTLNERPDAQKEKPPGRGYLCTPYRLERARKPSLYLLH